MEEFTAWQFAFEINWPLELGKGGFKSEDTGEFLQCQHKYSISLSWAENLNFSPKTVNNLFKFSAQDSDLEYFFWQGKKSSVSSDLKTPLQVILFEINRAILKFTQIVLSVHKLN